METSALAYLEVTTIGMLGLVVAPVLLVMGAAALVPALAAVRRVALGLCRPVARAVSERVVSFGHLPDDLATLGTDTLALLGELEHFSLAGAAVSTPRCQRWWSRLGTTFGDPGAYNAETRTAHEVWQWVFVLERLPVSRLEELRALQIDPARVRAELLSPSSLRERLPVLLGELERVVEALSVYAGTHYRGLHRGPPTTTPAIDVGRGPGTAADTDTVRRRRFQEIEHRYGYLLRRVASGHTRTDADRDDLLQDIRLAVWNALPSYRGESSLRTYAVRIARNRAASAFRRRCSPPAPIGEPTIETDVELRLEANARRGWLARALAQLSPAIAETLERRLAGDSYQEIADALGITTSNVGVRLHSGKSRLRALAIEEQ